MRLARTVARGITDVTQGVTCMPLMTRKEKLKERSEWKLANLREDLPSIVERFGIGFDRTTIRARYSVLQRDKE